MRQLSGLWLPAAVTLLASSLLPACGGDKVPAGGFCDRDGDCQSGLVCRRHTCSKPDSGNCEPPCELPATCEDGQCVVTETETVTAPAVTGPATGAVGQPNAFTASGSTSDLGHAIQYEIDCGNGTTSGWLAAGTTSHECTYSSAGTFAVTGKARCAQHMDVESASSSPASITISSTPTYALTVNISPAGGGTVTLDPPGGSYAEGASVTLTAVPSAVPAPGYVFSNWSGDATGSQNPLTITMPGNPVTVTANFTPSGGTNWSTIVAGAPHLAANLLGGYGIQYQGIAAGATNYYVFDPKGDSLLWYGAGQILVDVRDNTQSIDTDMTVYTLNANNDQMSVKTFGEAWADRRGYVPNFTTAEYDAGYKLLIELKFIGGNPCGSCLGVYCIYK